MQPARHIAFFIGSPQNCPGIFNAADEAEICSRPENYGRNLTLQTRAATARNLFGIGVEAVGGVFHRAAARNFSPRSHMAYFPAVPSRWSRQA
jgi:hypothetical protein